MHLTLKSEPASKSPASPPASGAFRFISRAIGRAGRGVFGRGVVVIELTDGKPLLGGDFYRAWFAGRLVVSYDGYL